MLYNPKNWNAKTLKQQLVYANTDPRRRQELKDSNMVSEDHEAMANLPTRAIHREYNNNTFDQCGMFDDEIGSTWMK